MLNSLSLLSYVKGKERRKTIQNLINHSLRSTVFNHHSSLLNIHLATSTKNFDHKLGRIRRVTDSAYSEFLKFHGSLVHRRADIHP